ncbi:MAG: IS1634 family transposase [Candidatus Pacebacteria bacterium]|nr:IS1634 family transposase [Candidatus Paceibacterota bacterium]
MNRSIRVTKTTSGARAVQVVEYRQRKVHICKHIGSAHSDQELKRLQHTARAWILTHPPQAQLIPTRTDASRFLLEEFEYRGIHYAYAYEFLHRLCDHFGFCAFGDNILTDLVIMRIFEPASKLRSLTLLSKHFSITHTELTLYRHLRTFPSLKQKVEEKIVAIAKNEFSFDFSFVLYDVTTLYFETFKSDDLRKPGFSKDNKSQQPQIVIGLMVTPQGFPVSYEVFAGNTFEGTTFLPSILAFKSLHQIETLTIVADAAMLSLDNMQKLTEHGLTYIVGARLGNIKAGLLHTIDSELERVDQKTMRAETPHGTLVCGFSKKRYSKDLSEMNKQIEKAKRQVDTPGKMRRAKFVSAEGGTVSLNEGLIADRKKLLGVKGYYTNLKSVSDVDIIAHYHSLWHVEQAFRVAKSDIASRPIFHHKVDSIKAHMLICVMALAISKYIEIKSNQSIRSVLDLCRTVTDAILVHRTTGEVTVMRSKIPVEMLGVEKKCSTK